MQRLLVAILFTAACGPGVAPRSSHSVSMAGASSTVIPPGSNVDDADDVHCKIEVPTGTHLSRPVCRSQVQIETDRTYAEFLLRHPQDMESR
jgi:hypothetical protein